MTESVTIESKKNISNYKKCKDCCKKCYKSKCCQFYVNNSFIINVVLVIAAAFAYPPFAPDYLAPKITASWIAVMFIFLNAGISLKTKEIAKAFTRIWFNLFV